MTQETALPKLRSILHAMNAGQDPELAELAASRVEVLARYQPVFDRKELKKLTADEFKSFLLFRNNRHWKAIHRQGNQIVEDMPTLRKALGILLDEARPLADRLRELRPKNRDPMVKGLARSVITPILLVAQPNKYGVLNQVAEAGMKAVGAWPENADEGDFAQSYTAVNAALINLTRELNIDLWTLDALWWRVPPGDIDVKDPVELDGEIEPDAGEHAFGLELHLHDFLRDNWNHTEFGREWALLEKDGEIVGYKYNTGEVGQIDLLAKHRTQPRWLVIELKRGQTSDQAVGQALRYRGWVRRRLAKPGESVQAIVVAHAADPKLLYALEGVEDVAVRTYVVRFTLTTPTGPWEDGSR